MSEQDSTRVTRRSLLTGIGSVSTPLLAGCIGGNRYANDAEEKQCLSPGEVTTDGPIRTINAVMGRNDGIMHVNIRVQAADEKTDVDVIAGERLKTHSIPPSTAVIQLQSTFCRGHDTRDGSCVIGVGLPEIIIQVRRSGNMVQAVHLKVDQADSQWSEYPEQCNEFVVTKDTYEQ